jgi:hypothetical protein
MTTLALLPPLPIVCLARRIMNLALLEVVFVLLLVVGRVNTRIIMVFARSVQTQIRRKHTVSGDLVLFKTLTKALA